MPKVSILLPTHQSGAHLRETLDSIKAQTYQDYELLVVDDASTDQTLEILREYPDLRIQIIQGRNQGLADALNLGIKRAQGQYIARIDADDLMVPERLEKQVRFLDTHQNVIVCGGWQQYFGLSTFLHAPPASAEQCRANLLFRCDLCHSTLMLRTASFIDHNLFYDPAYAAEDFELWTRVLDVGDIANIPEVLGYYREDGKSITTAKKERLIRQNGEIVAASLKRNLGIELSEKQEQYFTGWTNPFYQKREGASAGKQTEAWRDLRAVLLNIYQHNQETGYYCEAALLKTLRAEWTRLRYQMPFLLPKQEISPACLFQRVSGLEVIIHKGMSFQRNYRGIYRKYRKIRSVLQK